MGIEQPYGQELPDDDVVALEGEIVVYRDYPRGNYSHGDGWTGPRPPRNERFGPRNYDQALVRKVITYTVTHPQESCASIARRFGVSAETVRRWTRNDVDTRAGHVDTPKLRAEAAVHLEGVRAEAWDLFQAIKDSLNLERPETTGDGAPATIHLPHPAYLKALQDALVRVESVTGSHAKLMGLNMPAKVDVQLTQLTEAERELQEMINEAAARTEAMRADVIAEASEDPDL